MQIDQSRLREDIERTGEFGAVKGDGRGRTALAGTKPNERARDYFVEQLKDTGLTVRIDAVGNIIGEWTPESSDPGTSPIVAGSHLDSVREGGIFDGPLGVYAALESVRAMQEAEVEPTRPVWIISFTEEEGQRFGNLVGSSTASGHFSVEEALALENEEGVTLEAGLADIGYQGDGRVDASEWGAFLELHIEQGRRLEEAEIPVGIVSAITGITQATVTVSGEANHAGTTAMNHRTDALAAASEFVLDVERAARDIVRNEAESAVGTVGRQVVSPNSTNVIPGEVRMGVDVRDVDPDNIETILTKSRESLARLETERSVETSLEPTLNIDPVPMSDRCRKAIRNAAATGGIDWLDLHSGAGHDAMRIASVTDAGMVFVSSRDGVSHSPKEWTDWEDCATATRVLGGAIADLATD